MSIVVNQSQINNDKAFFLLANMSSVNSGSISTAQITTSSIGGITGQFSTLTATQALLSSLTSDHISCATADIGELNNSTIYSLGVFIDGAELTTIGGNELLLNGIPIATTQNLSSLQQWAYDPALSTVNMAGNDLVSTNTISTINLRAGSAFIQNLLAWNILSVSSYTSTVSSVNMATQDIQTSTLEAGTASILSLGVSSINNTSIATSSITGLSTINGQSYPPPGTGSTISSFQTVTASQYVSTAELFVSSINGAELTQNAINISTIVTNNISSALLSANLALMSTFQLAPNASFSPNLNIDFGLGSLFANTAGAAAGGLSLIVGTAALATGTTALFSGRQTRNIYQSSFELVNGTTQLQISTLGLPASTVTRFVSSPNISTPGEEYFISSIIPAGSACIRSMSDPLNTVSSPLSTIQAFGEWQALPPATGTISSLEFSTLTCSTLIAANTISTASLFVGNTISTGAVSLANLFAIGIVSTQLFEASTILTNRISTPQLFVSSINGLSINPSTVYISTVQATEVSTNNIDLNFINGLSISSPVLANPNYSTVNVTEIITASTVASSKRISCGIGQFDGNTISTNTISTNSIKAAGISTTTISSAVASISSLNTNSISTNTLTLNNLVVSGISTTKISTNSIIANTISTIGAVDVGGQLTVRAVAVIGTTIYTYSMVASTINQTLGGTSILHNTTTDTLLASTISTTSLNTSTINSIPVLGYTTPAAYTSKILWSSLSTTYQAIASTFLSTQVNSLVQVNFNASAQSLTNQFHDVNLYVALDTFSSLTSITSLPSGTGHYTNGSINYIAPVSTGTHRVVAYMNCDANATGIVVGAHLSAVGNLSQG